MSKMLGFAGVAEAVTGLALLVVPSLVGQLLLGQQLVGVAIPVARITGIALFALGIACWPATPLIGMFAYSSAVTLYLAYLGFCGRVCGRAAVARGRGSRLPVNPSRSGSVGYCGQKQVVQPLTELGASAMSDFCSAVGAKRTSNAVDLRAAIYECPTWEALLLRQPDRELAVAHARGEALGELGHGVLAVGGHQFGQSREHAGLRQAIAVDAVVAGFGPGFVEVAQRRLLLLVIRQGFAGDGIGRRQAHCTQRIFDALPGTHLAKGGVARAFAPPRAVL
jgi:hypothetical protein